MKESEDNPATLPGRLVVRCAFPGIDLCRRQQLLLQLLGLGALQGELANAAVDVTRQSYD
jgi:hypothetical protein